MIAIILVNWNGAGDTLECLESISRLDLIGMPFKVIVSDNGSLDGSLPQIQEWCEGGVPLEGATEAWSQVGVARTCEIGTAKVFGVGEQNNYVGAPFVSVLCNGANIGFAAANNAAMNLALTDPSVKYFWILNNDTIAKHDALAHLCSSMEKDPALGIVGSALAYYDDPSRLQGVMGWYNMWMGRGGLIGGGAQVSELPKINLKHKLNVYPIAASFLVSRDFLEKVGPMSEGYFLYFEEIDWVLRGKRWFDVGCNLKSIVFHKEGGSIGTSTRARESNTSIFYFNRASLLFSFYHNKLTLPIIFIRIAFRALRFIVQRDNRGASALGKSIVSFVKVTLGLEKTLSPYPGSI